MKPQSSGGFHGYVRYAQSWRTDNTGLVEVWQNGVKVWSVSNIQTGLEHDTVEPYAKFGIYSSPWKFEGNPDPNGTVHARYHDAFRVCNVAGCSYADVAPRGDRLGAD
jgi:hypothetical protein